MDELSQPHDFEPPRASSPGFGSHLPEPPPIPEGRQFRDEPLPASPASAPEEIGERAFEEIAERAIQFLRANPIPAVLGGLALGFMVGRLMRRH